jgi:hypothetical protein
MCKGSGAVAWTAPGLTVHVQGTGRYAVMSLRNPTGRCQLCERSTLEGADGSKKGPIMSMAH